MNISSDMDINAIKNRVLDRYSALTGRQKVLLFFGVSMLIFILGNLFFISPVKKKAAAADVQATSLQAEVEATQLKIDLLMAEVQNSLANPGSARAQSLKGQVDDLDVKLASYYQHLIPASQMGPILQQALAGEGLELLSIRSLDAEEMVSYETAETGESAHLFRKGIEMVFKGDYFTTIGYLKKLESLGQRLLWGYLAYEVEEYPAATVTIRVYTLSSEEGWIGG